MTKHVTTGPNTEEDANITTISLKDTTGVIDEIATDISGKSSEHDTHAEDTNGESEERHETTHKEFA